jgi:hypothetical protein
LLLATVAATDKTAAQATSKAQVLLQATAVDLLKVKQAARTVTVAAADMLATAAALAVVQTIGQAVAEAAAIQAVAATLTNIRIHMQVQVLEAENTRQHLEQAQAAAQVYTVKDQTVMVNTHHGQHQDRHKAVAA